MSDLMHYGVLGMKWGKRKNIESESLRARINVKTKKNETIQFNEQPSPPFVRLMSKLHPKVRRTLSKSKSFDIKHKDVKVGEMDIYKRSDSEINVVWVNVNNKYSGKGYGTAAMRGVINYARKTGNKKVTLEVPGTSPNARHIYSKLGFKVTKEAKSTNDVWGGLTEMELKL